MRDRSRYMSSLPPGPIPMETNVVINPLRYSMGHYSGDSPNFEEENEGEITQGDRLNEIKARRMQQHHHHIGPSSHVNVSSSLA